MLAVERAAIEQHLAEARVVHRGADHATAAGLPGLRHARVVKNRIDADGAIVRERLDNPVLLALVGDVSRSEEGPTCSGLTLGRLWSSAITKVKRYSSDPSSTALALMDVYPPGGNANRCSRRPSRRGARSHARARQRTRLKGKGY